VKRTSRSPLKSQQTRRRIVGAAASAFRQHGIAGIGVRNIMKRAGLTQGGFYFHFRDKDELFKEAARHAFAESPLFEPIRRAPRGRELRAFIESYLSVAHRDSPDSGCMMAAVGNDVARADRKAREDFNDVVSKMLDRLAPYVDPAEPAAGRLKAGLLLSSMSGVLTVSRVLADDRKSRALLASARAFYIASFCAS